MKRIVLVGATEITEIAILCAQEFELDIVAIAAENPQETKFGDIRLVDDIRELTDFDAIIFTALGQSGEDIDTLRKHSDESRIFIPPILGVPSINIIEDEAL